MLDITTLHNRPEIAKHCIVAGAPVTLENPYDLHFRIIRGHSFEICKVLAEHGLDINRAIEHFRDILQCAVEDENIDWVRFYPESRANPILKQDCSEHLILATTAFLPPLRYLSF